MGYDWLSRTRMKIVFFPERSCFPFILTIRPTVVDTLRIDADYSRIDCDKEESSFRCKIWQYDTTEFSRFKVQTENTTYKILQDHTIEIDGNHCDIIH